jgi:hypothetical protein
MEKNYEACCNSSERLQSGQPTIGLAIDHDWPRFEEMGEPQMGPGYPDCLVTLSTDMHRLSIPFPRYRYRQANLLSSLES